jgi:hypothetical protein
MMVLKNGKNHEIKIFSPHLQSVRQLQGSRTSLSALCAGGILWCSSATNKSGSQSPAKSGIKISRSKTISGIKGFK